MTALVSSVSNGWEGLWTKKRAVPINHFNSVCARHEVKKITFDLNDLAAFEGDDVNDGEEKAAQVMEKWANQLKEEQLGKCVEVQVNPFDTRYVLVAIT